MDFQLHNSSAGSGWGGRGSIPFLNMRCGAQHESAAQPTTVCRKEWAKQCHLVAACVASVRSSASEG